MKAKILLETLILSLFMKITRREQLIPMCVAIVGSAIFFLPIVGSIQATSSGWPGFMMSGDVEKFYFPSYVEGYRRFWSGGLLGVDFLTNDGASVFAYRANLSPFYPPYILSYLLFDISKISTAMWVYCLIHVLHMIVALYACVRFARRFLGFGYETAALFAFFFCLSSQAASYIAFATFYFQMMLVPIVAYALCALMLTRSITKILLSSVVFVTLFLTSYAPAMACAFLTALALAGYVYVVRIAPRFREGAARRLLAPTIAVFVAGLVVLPYYLAQLQFVGEVNPAPKDLNSVAKQLAFSGRDLASGLSNTLRIGRTVTEGRLNWGLIPALLVVLGLIAIALRREMLPRSQTRLWCFAITVYVGFLSITLGNSLPTSDMFYYGVPVLGSMHIFQRYLIFGQIFFALAAAGGAALFLQSATPAWRGAMLASGLPGWVFLSFWINANGEQFGTNIDVGALLAELFLCFSAIAVLCAFSPSRALLGVGLIASVISIQQMYSMQANLGRPEIWAAEIDPTGSAHRDLTHFFKENSDKQLSKVLYLTPGPGSFLYRNYPWLVGSDVKLMSYQGYEPHLSMVSGYRTLMGGFYGEFDRDWVLRTGLDYIVWDDATAAKVDNLQATFSSAVRLGPRFRAGASLSAAKIEFVEPVTMGMTTPSLDLKENAPETWPTITVVDGWRLDTGRIQRIGDGPNNFHIPVSANGNTVYAFSFRTNASTGLITTAFGGFGGEPAVIDKPGTYTILLRPKERSDLWIGGTGGFDGYLTDIVVKEVPDHPIEMLPVAFDNGILRVEAQPGSAIVNDSVTDYSTRVSMDVTVDSDARLVYQLWPISYMVPFLDGERVSWVREGNWPAYLPLVPGRHRFELRFESGFGSAFQIALAIYGVLMLGALAVFLATTAGGERLGGGLTGLRGWRSWRWPFRSRSAAGR